MDDNTLEGFFPVAMITVAIIEIQIASNCPENVLKKKKNQSNKYKALNSQFQAQMEDKKFCMVAIWKLFFLAITGKWKISVEN